MSLSPNPGTATTTAEPKSSAELVRDAPKHNAQKYEYDAFVSYRRRDASKLAQWISGHAS